MFSKIWVIGDSHARTFAYNKNFMPIFMGSGREYCFINNKNMANVISTTKNIIRNGVEQQDAMMFLLGEPDTRIYLKKGWKPWLKRFNKGFTFWLNKVTLFLLWKIKIKESFQRYAHFISEIDKYTDVPIMVLNILPSIRMEQNKLVDYFNQLLLEFCAEQNKAEFIEINQYIYDNRQKKIKSEFYGDQVHLNMKIQLLVENWLLDKNYIRKRYYTGENHKGKKEIKKNFTFNEKFGCYTL